MRAVLDRFYALCLWLAALCLVAMLALVTVLLVGRIIDGIMKAFGLPAAAIILPSVPEMAGFLMAASSFLALAATLKAGAHIRVTLVLALVGERRRPAFELIAFAAACGFAAYMAWQVAVLACDSWQFREVSTGIIAVPLALPQAAMALGLVALTIALFDELVIVALRRRPSFRAAEDAINAAKEA